MTERAELAAAVDTSALRLAVERTLQPESEHVSRNGDESRTVGGVNRMHVLQVLFLVALLANGAVLAKVVTGTGKPGTAREALSGPPSGAVASETVRIAPTPIVGAAESSAARAQSSVASEPRLSRRSVTAKTQIERRILAQIVKAPRARLPAALIDASTGLAKNNLQVLCRPGRVTGSLLCVVRLAGNDRGKQAYVSYRLGPDGRGTLAWGRRR